MTGRAVRSGDSPKPHRDKLQGATGNRSTQAKAVDVAPREPPLKDQGDKLQSALDRATRS